MRMALVLLPLMVTPDIASAKCFSVWHYPWRQHCGGVYARTSPVRPHADRPVPPPVVRADPVVAIPIPDLTGMVWDTALDTPGQLELSHDMERLRALRKLEEELQ